MKKDFKTITAQHKRSMIIGELMKRKLYISKEDREKIITMGKKAMNEYKNAFHKLNTIGCFYFIRNPKLLDHYLLISLN